MSDTVRDIRVIAIRFISALALLAVYAVYSTIASFGLDVSHTSVPVAGLPDELVGLRIAEIADLHSSRFGAGQSELIGAIRNFKPDIIVITGDFIDGVSADEAPCVELVRGLATVAPVYRVRGNHEYYLDSAFMATFDADMAATGAVLLENRAIALQKNGQRYLLAGMDDVGRYNEDPRAQGTDREQFAMETATGYMAALDRNTPPGEYPLKIMLCHQPPFWQLWRDAGYNVALCGHLHGWMIRLPGFGGVFRRPSKFFPEEDAGLYDKQGIMVYISRGLDNQKALRNLRMNNKPELALLQICKK